MCLPLPIALILFLCSCSALGSINDSKPCLNEKRGVISHLNFCASKLELTTYQLSPISSCLASRYRIYRLLSTDDA